MEPTEPVRRTSEIEEITNLYVIHPIASRLTPLFARLHIHPNAVSVAGMVFGILAGAAYAHYQDWRYATAGFVLMIAWHVMDGADGQLARLTHSQSEFGKVLDGICDYVTFIAVYTGLAVTLARQYGDWVWSLALCAGACHAVQAAAYERQRETYDLWGRARKPAAPASLDPAPEEAARTSAGGFAALLHRLYARAQRLGAGDAREFNKGLSEALALQPEQSAAIRQRYREVFAPQLRRWSVLSANYRTLGIFVCALLKAPLYYFGFEIIVFSALLIVLVSEQKARQALFLRNLESSVQARRRTFDARGERDKPPTPSTAPKAPGQRPAG
jgi:phosphatidylglycerophosphate synthase